MLNEVLELRNSEKPDWFNITEQSKIYWTINCDALVPVELLTHYFCIIYETEEAAIRDVGYVPKELKWDENKPVTVTLREALLEAIKYKMQGVVVKGIRDGKLRDLLACNTQALNFDV